jgi:hypothetical protein
MLALARSYIQVIAIVQILISVSAIASQEKLSTLKHVYVLDSCSCRREAPDNKAERLLKGLSKAFHAIEYGTSWKDSLSQQAAGRLQELDFSSVAEAIECVDDVNAQWELAISFTDVCASAISEAEYIKKLSSIGEWCCDVADTAIALWEQSLLADGSAMPSTELLAAAKALSHFGGDYLCDNSDIGTLLEEFLQHHNGVAETVERAAAPAAAAEQDVIVID